LQGIEQSGDLNLVPLDAMNHPGGTCKIGRCFDKNTLIMKGGVTNIIVVDNSIVREQAVVHSSFPLMAIALRGAGILNNFLGEVHDTSCNCCSYEAF
jgi:hypothetical protein